LDHRRGAGALGIDIDYGGTIIASQPDTSRSRLKQTATLDSDDITREGLIRSDLFEHRLVVVVVGELLIGGVGESIKGGSDGDGNHSRRVGGRLSQQIRERRSGHFKVVCRCIGSGSINGKLLHLLFMRYLITLCSTRRRRSGSSSSSSSGHHNLAHGRQIN